MAAIRLKGGYYTARSIIADAQACTNLYPERNTPESPAPYTDYPTPGLAVLATLAVPGPARGLYTATNGELYYVAGPNVYYVAPDWTVSLIGTIGTMESPVSMQDNGTDMLIGDGSANSYAVALGSRIFSSSPIADYFGASRLAALDTYLIGKMPGAATFFASDSGGITFDPLWVANKVGYPDPLVTLAVAGREIWLIGSVTTEVWFNSGAADFPFQRMEGPFVQHGTAAPNSVCQIGDAVFWLSTDRNGGNVALIGKEYNATAISTMALHAEWTSYSDTSDAWTWAYQQEGHQFFVITFPSADKTWCYDISTGLWHRRAWTDGEGVEHRHRAACGTFAYGANVVGDWETGTLYRLDQDADTDAGDPIVRRRGFPHMVNDGDRLVYSKFIADIEVGRSEGTSAGSPVAILLGSPGLGFGGILSSPSQPDTSPKIYLRWSDDRGASWGNPVARSMGATGQFLTSVQWTRLGMARDRVFELFWSAPLKTALQGAFVTARKSGT